MRAVDQFITSEDGLVSFRFSDIAAFEIRPANRDLLRKKRDDDSHHLRVHARSGHCAIISTHASLEEAKEVMKFYTGKTSLYEMTPPARDLLEKDMTELTNAYLSSLHFDTDTDIVEDVKKMNELYARKCWGADFGQPDSAPDQLHLQHVMKEYDSTPKSSGDGSGDGSGSLQDDSLDFFRSVMGVPDYKKES